jgi:signal transduction histidine kinase/ActR/RegA family two-component response regulator
LIGMLNQAGRMDTIALSDPGWNACRIPQSDAIQMIRNMELRGILGHTLSTGECFLSNAPRSHPDSIGTPEGHVPVTAFMSVPLKRGVETFGMIALANKQGGYDSADQEMVEALSAVFAESLIRKQAEDALRKKEEEFRQAQKLEAVGALAGGVAHEFNNLLQAIRAFTTFALKGLSPEETRYQDLQEVLKASERAVILTRQLLGFSRRQQFQMIDIRLNEILVDLKKMLQPLIGEKIELQMSLADDVGLLHVDPTMVQQVVMNLCINARDAMPTGGKLLIKTEDVALGAEDCQSHPDAKPGHYLRLTVSDTGTGIPPEALKRIFEPFFSTKEVGKGTGLGLAMVYGVVQQHRGMIRVHSRPGEGATFEIYLPVAEARPQAAAPATPVSAGGGTETILFAEDDPLVRAALVRVLTEAGYRVLAAADGDEAVKLFADNSPTVSLVLLDMMMPKMGGREAHAKIARINPDIPTIYCTGYDSGLAKLDAAEIAALSVVQKPVDPEALLSAIRELLDRKKPCPVG